MKKQKKKKRKAKAKQKEKEKKKIQKNGQNVCFINEKPNEE